MFEVRPDVMHYVVLSYLLGYLRPVGPGYDKGRGERLREEVDPQYKCDFFKWQSDVKRAALRESKKR